MKTSIRQGIVHFEHTQRILTLTNGTVSMVLSEPLYATISYVQDNINLVEQENVVDAWNVGRTDQRAWLFIDIDLLTGARTFVVTRVDPFDGGGNGLKLPANPKKDRHYFDHTSMCYKVWSGLKWVQKARLYMGSVFGSTVEQPKLGSHIGFSGSFDSGDIVRDQYGSVIRKDHNSGLLLSTDVLSADSNTFTLDQQTASFIEATAAEAIPLHHGVTINEHGKVVLAGIAGKAIGLSMCRAAKDQKVLIKNDPSVMYSEAFKFIPGPVYFGKTGELTQTTSYLNFFQKAGEAYSENIMRLDIGAYEKILQ